MKRDDLALIEYTREPITPLPWAYECNTEATWKIWDAAVCMQDVTKPFNRGDLT